MAELVQGAAEIAAATRAAMLVAFGDAAFLHRRFLDLAADLRAGRASTRDAGVADAAFRPNFNARKADEFFAAEEWTEAVRRYANAGETLVREVMVAIAHALGRPELASTQKLNQFKSLGESVAKLVGVSLAADPAWNEFTRVYGIRNTRFGHGQEEAELEAAVEARAAWVGLRAMLATRFASAGVTVARIQHDAMTRRAEEWSVEEVATVEAMTAAAQAVRQGGFVQLRGLVERHEPTVPVRLLAAIEALPQGDRARADEAVAAALAQGFETVMRLWESTTDTNSILFELVSTPS